MSAVRRRTANDLLCGAITAPLLEYSIVILVHGVSHQNLFEFLGQGSKISVQIARVNEELPLLKTKTISVEKCVFEEVVVVHTETLEELEILLCTAEEVIDEYDLKLADRQIFEQYHITLAGQNSELFVTLVIKAKDIPQSPAPTFDVQLLIQYLETPLNQPREAAVLVAKDHFENAYSQIAFNTKEQCHISLPCGPSDQPQWYHTFLFRGCNINQSLGLYLFHQPFISKQNYQWMLGDKIGECAITLDQNLVGLLRESDNGVCFTKVPLIAVQACLFVRISLKMGVSPVLTPNLITEPPIEWGNVGEVQTNKQTDKQTDKQTNKQTNKQTDRIPEEPEKEVPVITTAPTEDKTDLALPDHSAILQLLQRHCTPQHPTKPEKVVNYDRDGENSTEYMSKIIDQQAIELKKYRDAVQKMGRDIVACRDYIVSLKKENTRLKSKVSQLEEPILDISLSNIPKDNLIKEVLRARKALKDQMENNRETTQTLDDLRSRFSSFEKERHEIGELRHAHTAQNKLLQKLQEKVKVTRVLEKTCKDQEKIIEQLEGMLDPGRPALMAPPSPDTSSFAVAKIEPTNSQHLVVDSYDSVPAETSLKLRVRALEHQLRYSQQAHQDEMTRLASDKMDLQLQLARIRR